MLDTEGELKMFGRLTRKLESIIPEVKKYLESLGINLGSKIGRGAFGVVYDLKDSPNTVLKLTTDQREVRNYQYICLLYTSPSPRDRTRSRMPSSA